MYICASVAAFAACIDALILRDLKHSNNNIDKAFLRDPLSYMCCYMCACLHMNVPRACVCMCVPMLVSPRVCVYVCVCVCVCVSVSVFFVCGCVFLRALMCLVVGWGLCVGV